METDPLAELPLIIKRVILEKVKYPIFLKDAKKLRLELMDERSSQNPTINEIFRPDF
ncbi:hypothetical protein J3B02_005868, partial [Coemansia erecta]